MEGHAVEGNAVVSAVHPVHEGEERDAAHEEGEQDHASIGLVYPALLQAQLNKYFPQRDKGCADLRQKQTANEEVSLVFPEEQSNRQQDGEQSNMMQHQQELFPDKGVHSPERVLFIVLVPFDPETIVVTEVHGEEVVGHVGNAVPDDKVSGKPVPLIDDVVPTRQHHNNSCCGGHERMDGGHQSLADQHDIGIAPVSEHARQDSPKGEKQTGENYGATSQNLQHPGAICP